MKTAVAYMPCPLAFLFILFTACPGIATAQDLSSVEVKTVYGLGGIVGKSIDPVTDIHSVQLSGFALWDYDKIWRHWAPEPMRFKVEGALGASVSPSTRLMASVEMLALYYFFGLSTKLLLPYIEGGIGCIYTDFQVKDSQTHEEQGSRLSFNPLIGIGTDIKTDSDTTYFATLRLSHISNANLNDDNRGMNSLLFMFGKYF